LPEYVGFTPALAPAGIAGFFQIKVSVKAPNN